jgi:hypothetical protein
VGLSSFAYDSLQDNLSEKNISKNRAPVSFYLKGTGSKGISVKIGVSSKIG